MCNIISRWAVGFSGGLERGDALVDGVPALLNACRSPLLRLRRRRLGRDFHPVLDRRLPLVRI